MKLQEMLTGRNLRRMLATPRGRAMVLSVLAEAEDSDEGQFFDLLAERVDDDRYRKLIRRHQEDEKRHARLFRECAERQGVDPGPVPPELLIIDRLDQALGGFFDGFVQGRFGVMEAYALLQVIEERAITQFRVMEPVFRAVDPASADVLAEVARDEDRHLKYCWAIARHYAPDDHAYARTVRRFREVEARCFAESSRAHFEHALASGTITVSLPERLALRGLSELGRRLGQGPRTPFWSAAPAGA